jgi:hypothetical protein
MEDILDRILLKGRLKIVYMSTTCSYRMLVGLFDVARIIGLWCLRAGGIVGSVGRGSMEDDEWRGISGRLLLVMDCWHMSHLVCLHSSVFWGCIVLSYCSDVLV